VITGGARTLWFAALPLRPPDLLLSPRARNSRAPTIPNAAVSIALAAIPRDATRRDATPEEAWLSVLWIANKEGRATRHRLSVSALPICMHAINHRNMAASQCTACPYRGVSSRKAAITSNCP
jgi:hypothetical protein